MKVKVHEMHECKSCEYSRADLWASLEVMCIFVAMVIPVIALIGGLYNEGYKFGIAVAIGGSVWTVGICIAFVELYKARLAYWIARISKNPVRYYSTK
jgi:hypothetical protein